MKPLTRAEAHAYLRDGTFCDADITRIYDELDALKVDREKSAELFFKAYSEWQAERESMAARVKEVAAEMDRQTAMKHEERQEKLTVMRERDHADRQPARQTERGAD
jgi:hypothetical protein